MATYMPQALRELLEKLGYDFIDMEFDEWRVWFDIDECPEFD